MNSRTACVFFLLLSTICSCKQSSVGPLDSTESWSLSGLANRSVFSFTQVAAVLLAATDSGIFRSTDDGSTWIHTTTGSLNTNINSLIAYPATGSSAVLFAGTGNGVYRSTDNGTSWQQINSGLTNIFVTSFVMTPSAVNPNTIFVGTWGGIFSSTDSGATWTSANAGLTNANVNCLAAIDTFLFAGTLSGIYRSGNKLTNWSRLAFGSFYDDILSISSLSSMGITSVFAGTQSAGLFVSTNFGGAWTVSDSGFTASFVPALTVNGTTIFAAGLGVSLSSDFGRSWTPINSGLDKTDIRSLIVVQSFLFAGAQGGGVWKRKL